MAGLLLAELVVSWTGVAPEVAAISIGRFRYSPDPALGYEPIPHYEYDGDELLYREFRGRSNSLGFRDREHPIEKVPGVRRILVLGDSVTMGLYVDRAEDVFTAVLERRLGERGAAVEVLNFGVSGYNTQQEVATLVGKGLPYRPDLVVLQYSLNDVEEMNGGIVRRLREREEQSGGVDGTLLAPLLLESDLVRFLYFRVFAGDLRQRKERRDSALDHLARDTVTESFAELAAVAAREGFDVIVAVFPQFETYDERLYAAHERVAELATSHGFAVVDLLDPLVECYRSVGQEVAIDSMHPSAAGHRCAGETLAEFLLPLLAEG